MQRTTTSLLLVVLLLSATWVLAPTPAAQAESSSPSPFVHLNGYLVDPPFLAFFTANGGVASFGNPVTDAFQEAGGLTVQYFEFARMEWRGDHVALSHLGRNAAEGHPTAVAFAWIDSSAPVASGRSYIDESGHTLGGAFGWYWQANGGVARLGFPISEEFIETQPDGTTLLTQYFERAVLIYHPATATATDSVERVALGVRFAPKRPTTPAPRMLALARIAYRSGTGDAHNVAVALEKLNGWRLEPGQRLSFLGAAGPITEQNGYVAGSAIVGGNIVTNVIGGGVCTASTLVYRLAWMAGLPIETRSSHSYYLRFYADMPGLEAAVYDPGVDLVIRNDYPTPVVIETLIEAGGATLRLWGFSDGRSVMMEDAQVRAVDRRSNDSAAATRPNVAQWAAPVAPEQQQQGLEVVNVRVISRRDTSVQRDRVVTYYAHPPATEPDDRADEGERDDRADEGERDDGADERGGRGPR